MCGSDNVVVSDDEKSQIGVEIDFAQLLEDETTAAMMDANPDMPKFVKSMTRLSLYVSLPDSMAEMSDPSNLNFHFRLRFSKMGDCDAAYAELFGNAPAEDVEKNGKTYKKISSPNAPVVYILRDGNSIKAYSEKYVGSGSDQFATKGLSAALGKAPRGEPFKMAMDLKSAKDLIGELATITPQAEAFSQAESITVAGGGQGKLMFMMAVSSDDESTAKKVKSSLQVMFSFVALAMASQTPSENDAPAINEMISHFMSQLKPKVDGTAVRVVINKPDNYEELRKKMMTEAAKLGGDF